MTVVPTEPAVPPLTLDLDPYGRLILHDPAGRRVEGVEPIRAFPLSDPHHWIALVDPSGREVAMIQNPDSLEPRTRQLLLEELARREFVPVILTIHSISGHSPISRWSVITDRGPVTFQVEGDDALRRLGPHRLLVTDQDGTRYLIPDTRTLRPKIQRKLQALV
ncbi:MAG: hypothetical protein KatS3mg108_1181 [Isosphaeraceae bacterium]|jgi:hypothetical protein|nr:MAG: hypothetical protein KatS3mg108_1181 [Isosphaeraceae bacterium]